MDEYHGLGAAVVCVSTRFNGVLKKLCIHVISLLPVNNFPAKFLSGSGQSTVGVNGNRFSNRFHCRKVTVAIGIENTVFKTITQLVGEEFCVV